MFAAPSACASELKRQDSKRDRSTPLRVAASHATPDELRVHGIPRQLPNRYPTPPEGFFGLWLVWVVIHGVVLGYVRVCGVRCVRCVPRCAFTHNCRRFQRRPTVFLFTFRFES